MIILVVVLSLSAEYLAPYVPFESEVAMSKSLQDELEKLQTVGPQQAKIQTYLQALADQLADSQNLPKNMHVTIHYVDDDLVNAFATLGGHILRLIFVSTRKMRGVYEYH